MKAEQINIGDTIRCKNSFGLSYRVVEKFKTVCTVEHISGEKVMMGGKWIEEVFTYKGVRYSTIIEVVS